ncbi:MAG: hypothetical protein R3324_02705, partial [Halobacteriales archaeon]|nr:hypothetical protein [Halobacteriales archaeon]
FVGSRSLSLAHRGLFGGFFLVVGFAPMLGVQIAAAAAFVLVAAYLSEVSLPDVRRGRPT